MLINECVEDFEESETVSGFYGKSGTPISRFYNKRKVMFITSVCVLAFSACQAVLFYSASGVFSIADLIIMLLLSCGALFYALGVSRVPWISPFVSMLLAFSVSSLSLFSHSQTLTSLVIFMIFVPFAFFFNGAARGLVYILLYSAFITMIYLFFPDNAFFDQALQFNYKGLNGVIFSLPLVMLLFYSHGSYDEKILKKIMQTVVFDKMLNLPNKNSLMRNLPKNKDFILAIIKIQNFPDISSLFGYKSSEKILQYVAGVLSEMCGRDGYSCYKLMGHEFGVIIPLDEKDKSNEHAKFLLDLMWFELLSYRMDADGMEIYLTYRIGASVNISGDFSRALLKSDLALNMADKLFHNVYVYDENHVKEKERVMSSGKLYNELFDNIKNASLKTVYQPVADSATGEIKWHEALLRVKTGSGYSSIYPYLAIAKNTGLYNELTRVVLKSVRNRLLQSDTDISVNITLSDITHPGFMEDVLSICREVENRKGKLIIEIIESEELVEIDICRNFIAKVKEKGGKIAIDDFGSGYSNFCNLLNLSFDIVKIDGSLIRSAELDPNALTMIESISSFCHKSGKQIVAEYVESESLLDIVKKNNIHFAQGYLFGMPS
ncbi:MAG: GGDEF domain-containing protein [Spirochaetes bacterium]|nr:GGDEF domain-containing protein [Spirochaetota bacterium]